ncbi:hypothetical protein CLF_109662 [Clonorchis sinensis]|uniref:NAD dependent epimerase/dehydratase n=1 Tax=Clonorchis sinensis TaxID=79923 RepID=G7YSU0_CLOSI|nr:hypothetical protein CLF_109662 [Clonorchis sinensis]
MEAKGSQGSTGEAPSAEGLLVIGAGFARTGTMSLKTALQILYGKPCYHMVEIIRAHPEHIPIWTKIFNSIMENPNEKIPPELFKRIFHGYRTCTDQPGSSAYRQLMETYPEAKVVLTVRSPQSWLQSVRETVFPLKPLFGDGFFDRLTERLTVGQGFNKMGNLSFQLKLGATVDRTNDEQVLRGFVEHNEEVKRVVQKDRLLVFDVKEGWGTQPPHSTTAISSCK